MWEQKRHGGIDHLGGPAGDAGRGTSLLAATHQLVGELSEIDFILVHGRSGGALDLVVRGGCKGAPYQSLGSHKLMSNVSEAPATARIYNDPASVVAFSPNGEFYAIGYMSIRVEIYRQGELLSTFDLASHQDKIRPTERVRGLAFNEEGSLLFVAASDKLFALDRSGRIAWTYEPPRSFGFLIISPNSVSALAGRVVAAFDNGSMAVFDEQGNILRLWKDNETPRKLQMTRSGVVVGSDSFSLCGWEADSGTRIYRHKLSQRVFAFSASWDGELAVMRTLWEAIVVDPRSNTIVRTIAVDPSGPVVAMEPIGARMALSSSRGWQLYASQTGELLTSAETIAPVTSLAFDAAGTELIVGLADGSRQMIRL